MLAKKVLEEKTKGYKHHPQLARFRQCKNSLAAINYYLRIVQNEATKRNYNFNASKIDAQYKKPVHIKVTQGQVDYELQHLVKKLKLRDRQQLKNLKAAKKIRVHPLFKIVKGTIEEWEIR